MTFHVPEKNRVKQYSSKDDGNNGMFGIRLRPNGPMLKVVASDGMGWEHVSVSTQDRCPTWTEMCAIKDIFWDDEDCVIQYHPAKSEYVNLHPFCLHIWRPVDQKIPVPPKIFVGF